MINITSSIPIVGIYKITSPTGKIYIGQSTNITKRWSKYKKLDCKVQLKLYRSLLKHFPENHQFEIIEECNENQLDERELYWGNYYNVLGENGLNLKLGNGRGKVSDETKQRISNTNKGKPKSKETSIKISKSKKGISLNYKRTKIHSENLAKSNFKPILQHDLQNHFIKEWPSIKEAEIYYNPRPKNQDNIGACCRGKQKTAYGFIWKFKV